MIFQIIYAFLAAFIFSNLVEWVAHKYILHGLGKKKDSWFHYHWNHHNVSRKNNFFDDDYKLGFFKSSAVRREIYALFGILITNSYWILIWPLFYYFCVGFTVLYWFCHQYSHINVIWGKKYLPWHYDHHMGKNQDLNYCVTLPLWDYILGTRKKYSYVAKRKLKL
jgi:sterol desaturase/sphingolipid hydroxylase (fatty acid hydroxylase superfamily)